MPARRSSSRLVPLAALASALLLRATSAFAPPRCGIPSTTSRGNAAVSASVALFDAPDGAVAIDVPSDDTTTERRRVAVLLCPAQFCVPADYATLLNDIRSGHDGADVVSAVVAPLPRTEWIKVAKQLPSRNFLDATLSVRVTLDWYFDAMEAGFAELFAEAGEDVEVCVIGHSIGGWVARAYLGGLGGSSTAVSRLAQDRVASLVTLGTPHSSPESALVDQTRGLLREVESSDACSAQALTDRGIRVTCVGGIGLGGKILTTDPEELVAAASYLPLVGRLGDDVRGDGIVPAELAFLDGPARRVEVERCEETGGPVRHAHVLPTPWNLVDGEAPSIGLPKDVAWYGSPGVLKQWLEHV